MKRPIAAKGEFVASALGKLLAAQESRSVTISLEEYHALDLANHSISIEGEFEDEEEDTIPTSFTVTLVRMRQ